MSMLAAMVAGAAISWLVKAWGVDHLLYCSLIPEKWKSHEKIIEKIIESEVLPLLHAAPSLGVLLQMWSKFNKVFDKIRPPWSCFKTCRHIPRNEVAELKLTGLTCFRDLMYQKIKGQVKNAVINLIKKEDDDSEQNGRDSINRVLDILADNGLDQMDCRDYEDFFLKVITDFYVKAQNWILNDSHTNHMIETEEYLKQEGNYLQIDCSQHKLLEEVLKLLFAQLLVEKPSKCFSLLQDNRVEELCKMHKLFKSIHRLPKLSNMFKTHLTNQTTKLVSQAEHKEVLLWDIVQLHVKHATHVTKCFQDDTCFLEALGDSASRIWSPEIPASIFENSIRNSGASGKLCNQDKKVYQEIKGKVNDALNYLVNEQLKRIKILRDKNILEGEKILEGENIPKAEMISMALLSKFLNMFSGIEPYYYCYVDDFVVPLLESIKKFYSKKAPLLYVDNPSPNIYMKKADVFLVLEVERARQYSPFDIKQHILEELTHVLLAPYLEALLRDNKVEHFSGLYVLASETCGLPEYIAVILKRHLTNEITILFDSGKKDFLRKIIDLHDNYDKIITECFHGHEAFREAFKETFELICTKRFAGISGAVENILEDIKKPRSQDGSSDMSNDEECTYEDDMDNITRLITYNTDKDLFVKFYRDKLESRIQGCFAVLLNDRVTFLHKLYALLSKSSVDLKPLVDMFKNNLMNDISGIFKQEEDPASNKDLVMCKIIELHDRYEARATECFQGHPRFCEVLKEAFGNLCTNGVCRVKGAELLATFIDNILKKECNNEKLSDEGIRDFDKVVKILTCLNERDLFAVFYQRKLARRLLFNRSVHAHEKSFLDKLEQQFGVHITSPMKQMITDITIPGYHQTNFEEWVATTHPELNNEMDFSVTVLRSGLWPTMGTFNMNLPAEMIKQVEVFNEFYQTVPRRNKEKLTWIYSMGTCHANAKFEAGDIELIVTPCQAVLLLLFNESDRLSCSDMATQLNLPRDVVECLLHSLSDERYKILNKVQVDGSTSPDYEFNSKFTARNKSIKISPPKAPVVEKDREYEIAALVVRIIKRRGTMTHESLVEECVQQLSIRSKPDVKAIKKVIDDLITMEYMARNEENPKIYKYLPG